MNEIHCRNVTKQLKCSEIISNVRQRTNVFRIFHIVELNNVQIRLMTNVGVRDLIQYRIVMKSMILFVLMERVFEMVDVIKKFNVQQVKMNLCVIFRVKITNE